MEILPGHGFAVFLIEPALRKAAERAGLEGDEFELCGIVVDNHAAVAGVGFFADGNVYRYRLARLPADGGERYGDGLRRKGGGQKHGESEHGAEQRCQPF